MHHFIKADSKDYKSSWQILPHPDRINASSLQVLPVGTSTVSHIFEHLCSEVTLVTHSVME